jgi:hypothetical protein
MNRRMTWLAVIVIAAVAGGAGIASASPHHARHGRSIRVEEEQCTATASACSALDLGPPGASQGDVLVFSVRLLNPQRTTAVGRAIGHCTLTDPGTSAYVCEAITSLNGSTITLEGIFHPGSVSDFAVTGGTGAYFGVRGQFILTAALPTNHGRFELKR